LHREREEEPLLAIQGLRTGFKTRTGLAWAVDGIDLTIGRGKTVCLVGESGCGKTVTALSILRLVPGTSGETQEGRILFNGEDLLEMPDREMRRIRGNRISMIFQEPMTSLNPVFTIGNQVAEVIRLHHQISYRAAKDRAVTILSQVGLPTPEKAMKDYPNKLSGGMRQRAMIAMALSCHPELLIADEPTTALDVTIQAQILDLMEELREKMGMAILFISHDLGIVAQIADEVAIMYAGRIAEVAPVRDLYEAPAHPYTVGLLRSLPRKRRDFTSRQPLEAIPGMVPDLTQLPQGCRYQDRCGWTVDRCEKEEPPLLWFEGTEGHKRGSACWRHSELCETTKPC
jgi:peptide/nickel transport system ATP-binding protein/oligopeptide transport system ATP-binding protein